MQRQRTAQQGVRVLHARACPAEQGGRCACQPRYEASAYLARERRKLRKNFRTLAEARAWRSDAQGAIRRGTLRSASQTTLREAAGTWLAGAEAGTIRTRSGDEYKPSTLRTYQASLDTRLLPDHGSAKLSEIRRIDVQELVDRMLASGCDPSTIRNTLMPLRVIYRRAVSRGEITLNPMTGLELPAVRGRRDRIVTPEQAAQLLKALRERDRAIWATALYAGLRRGELMALRWQDIDLEQNLIRVERSWDIKAGLIEPKSRAGTRTIPVARLIREQLLAHKLRCPWRDGLAFGRHPTTPLSYSSLRERAHTDWQNAKLEPIGLHDCRHTYASLMIAAGVNPKALSTYMGHSSITITLDRYGHLMPGNEHEAAQLLDHYLEQSGPKQVALHLDERPRRAAVLKQN